MTEQQLAEKAAKWLEDVVRDAIIRKKGEPSFNDEPLIFSLTQQFKQRLLERKPYQVGIDYGPCNDPIFHGLPILGDSSGIVNDIAYNHPYCLIKWEKGEILCER